MFHKLQRTFNAKCDFGLGSVCPFGNVESIRANPLAGRKRHYRIVPELHMNSRPEWQIFEPKLGQRKYIPSALAPSSGPTLEFCFLPHCRRASGTRNFHDVMSGGDVTIPASRHHHGSASNVADSSFCGHDSRNVHKAFFS